MQLPTHIVAPLCFHGLQARFWKVLGASWASFGGVLGALGPFLAALGRLLGTSWPLLGVSWALLGVSWSQLGSHRRFWARFLRVLGTLRLGFEALWGRLFLPTRATTTASNAFHPACMIAFRLLAPHAALIAAETSVFLWLGLVVPTSGAAVCAQHMEFEVWP